MEKVRAWVEDLKWLDREDWWYVAFASALTLGAAVWAILIFPHWVMVFPLLACAGLVWSTRNFIKDMIRLSKQQRKYGDKFRELLNEIREHHQREGEDGTQPPVL